jgi:hypothetical protein
MRINDTFRNVLFFVFAACLTNAAGASVIVGLLLNPTSTAGSGANSTKSGAGTFHIYAVDDNVGTFGISSYSLTMGPMVTSSNNRSPVTTIQDGGGDDWSAGFNLLRTANS